MRLQLRASPVLTLLTAAVHAAAAAVLLVFLPPLAGACAAGLALVLGMIAAAERTLLWSSSAPAALELKRDGGLAVTLRGGSRFDASPAERRYVSRWLVVLELVQPLKANRTLLVAGDMLPAGDFRQLRLWALWKALPIARAAAAA